ncbi:DNA adenine methylase [Kluyvera ascorbata]|nr:DNA adenine methylase [Kluyvera ascorbata]
MSDCAEISRQETETEPRTWQRPFLKWAGGKFSLLPELDRLIPQGNVLLSLLLVAARCSLTQTSTNASFWLTSTLI